MPRVRVTLDGSGHGAADPAAIAVSREGTWVYVALAGSNQVAQVERSPGRAEEPAAATLGHSEGVEVVSVGRNPVALALSPDGTTLATANAMDDSLTLIDARRFEVAARIAVGPPRAERTAAQRGEAWFVDASLSQDRWMSCSTCHTLGHTASLQFDTLGDGGYGAAKNTPSLLGNHDTPPYGWTGRFARIEDQVAQSLSTSLRGRGAGPELVADLSAYLRSLPAPPPLRRADDPLAQHGARVFQERKCDRCHAGPGFTTVGVKDVGLDDGAGGHRAFNPPSLRGVGWSAPYFHDGRATDLDAVLLDHPRGSRELPADERAALRAYLESL
ncbi:MAG: cytochrome c peroxidase [Isosphaeraceae bacterium]